MKQPASALAAVALAWLVGSAAEAADSSAPLPVVMPALPEGAKPQPVAFVRLITSIEEGRQWITFDRTLFKCAGPSQAQAPTWTAPNKTLDRKLYGSLVGGELKAAGFVPADDPDSLFQDNKDRPDLSIAGNIKDAHATLCMHLTRMQTRKATGQMYDVDSASGFMVFDIDWQLYSGSQKKVVLNKEISTGAVIDEHAAGNIPRMIQQSIRENVRALIASNEFRKVVLAPVSRPDVTVADHTRLTLTGSMTAKTMKISDAVGSVVLILSGGGHGSGFLVSSDGYLMTAAHVVGADKYVKVRWSDGLESVGEVVRSDKRRDVALIKADARGRSPLALHLAMPEPGETTFAIGAPIDPKLQSTVTRGVVSANRIMDGFSFIQSDVTVDPGNSGGPLLNEKGEVLGFTDIGLRPKDAPTGLNFFVPIRDALDFLSLEQR